MRVRPQPIAARRSSITYKQGLINLRSLLHFGHFKEINLVRQLEKMINVFQNSAGVRGFLIRLIPFAQFTESICKSTHKLKP